MGLAATPGTAGDTRFIPMKMRSGGHIFVPAGFVRGNVQEMPIL
jgi:hypothetical protein